MPFSRVVGLVLMVLVAWVGAPVQADQGQPIALRVWPAGGVTIETMWDLHLGLGITAANQDQLPRVCDAVVKPTDDAFALDRLPNALSPGVQPLEAGPSLSPNAVRVWPVRVGADETNASAFLIEVDGVRVLDMTQAGAPPADQAALFEQIKQFAGPDELLNDVDVLLAPSSATEDQLLAVAELLSPGFVVLFPGSAMNQVGDKLVIDQTHNTLAVSDAVSSSVETQWLRLATTPWPMDTRLAQLFAAKEAACRDSQEVFAALSVNQMNFRPSNGTHTPRWNVEHMMSSELIFFSNVYHTKDPQIPVMNLRPAQMPNRYQAAHPDWTGVEEARQMQRIQAFSRRFAYLLRAEAHPQSAPPPQRMQRMIARPEQLLTLMSNHYPEHTAHVRDKMKLSDWPSQ